MQQLKLLILFILIWTSCAKITLQQERLTLNTASNWEMYGGNQARTNTYPGAISLPLKLKWHHSASAAIGKTILVKDGVIFFNTMDGRTYAYNIKTGEKIGHIKTEYQSTSIVKDSVLFFARRYGDNTLFKYNLNRGKTEWKFNAGDVASEPLILDEGIVVTALYKHIDYYDLSTGDEIWKFETDDQIRSSPATDRNTIVFGCDNEFIYAVNKVTGKIKWKYKTGGSVQATPSIKDGIVYVGSCDQYFYAINLQTGKLEWKFKTKGQIFQSAAINDSVVIFGSTDSQLYCLDCSSGDQIWTFEANSVISTSPLICKNKIFIGSLDHFYYALDIATGVELWKFETKGRIRTEPVIWKNYFIGASEDYDLYVFESKVED